ncbi:hypothetical protein KBY97_06585 [Synechococcus sp. ATX 2A4]|uniref:hypothetical protein n=1 Tax=Synechococcus sp. ATX 2A4 TaxID=2823727 RepID=UPI0020CEBF56|nr:hypothetical protein [Synechococcus sp. ATX 2A4]MCP9884793.1 hypothetical protein [Synechococcus sp. ATX 2A4]
MRLVGYALLLLLAARLGTSLSPAMATVPLRRLELATLLSDTAPFLLIAIGLIFLGGNGKRRRFEVAPLVALKALLFPLVLGYALLGPLVITDALRVYQGADQQGAARLEQAVAFRQQVLTAIEPVTTIPQLVTALQKFPVINARINQSDSIDKIKQSLTGTLDRAVTDLQSQQGQQMSGARTGLVGRTVLTVLLTTITATFLNLLRAQVLEPIRASGRAARSYFRADLVVPLASKRAAWASPSSAPPRSSGSRTPSPFSRLWSGARPGSKRPRAPGAAKEPGFWQRIWGGSSGSGRR